MRVRPPSRHAVRIPKLSKCHFLFLAFYLMLAGVLRVEAASSLTPYDCWGNLSFMPGPVNIGSFSANGTAVSFPPTQRAAIREADRTSCTWTEHRLFQCGAGATMGLYCPLQEIPWEDLSGSTCSLRPPGSFGGCPHDGLRLQQHRDRLLPYLGHRSGHIAIEYLGGGTSYAFVFDLGDGIDSGFNILSSGGVNCYINAVTFGRQTQTAGGGAASLVSAGNIPVFQPYSGSTFNGDFEVGNASVGNQYWGASVAATLQFITNPASTTPGAHRAGTTWLL